jgi:signal transduction histidine kinase
MEIIQRFELRVFRYGVIIAVVFRFIRSVHEFMIDSPMLILLLGVFNLFLFVIIFFLCRRHFQISFVIFFSQILVTSVLTWNNAGGWNGSVPYLLLVAMVGIAITSHGRLQIITLLAYTIIILLFNLTPIMETFSSFNSKYSLLSREVDFLINTAVLISVTFYLKENFISYRESVKITHERLERSSQKLLDQTKELQQQQADLNRLRNDLEKIIPRKISEAQNKAEMLKEYSFINSHHVRAPLARVLGLIHLIELEQNNQNFPHDALRNIKNDAEEIDMILTKVNTIIS